MDAPSIRARLAALGLCDPPATLPAPLPLRTVSPEPWAHQVAISERIATTPATYVYGGMGIGKTRCVIDAICTYDLRRTLVLCPASVVRVWPGQAARYAAVPLRVLALDRRAGSTATRAKALAGVLRTEERPVLAIINYEAAWRAELARVLTGTRWDLVVLDEAHRAKASRGRISAMTSSLREHADRMVALSGTPMPHSPLDLWAQYLALDPCVYGASYVRFRARYDQAYDIQKIKQRIFRRPQWRHLDELTELAAPITVRVDRDVLDLPPEVDAERHVDLVDERALYDEIEAELVVDVGAGTVTAGNALTRLLRLQQVSCGHVTDDEHHHVEVGASRRRALEDTLLDLGDEPVVVFARFRADLDAIDVASCTVHGVGALELSGRRNQLEEWQQADAAPVLAVQIQAGGVGVDLTRARYAIYYSIGYSLGDYQQARARVHRPGQTRGVTHVHLIADGTVDETIYRAIASKADVVSAVLEGFVR